MEHCDGGDLAAKVLRNKIIPEQEAKTIVRKSLCALRHLHGNNIAHRDFKPENILFHQGNRFMRKYKLKKTCHDQ